MWFGTFKIMTFMFRFSNILYSFSQLNLAPIGGRVGKDTLEGLQVIEEIQKSTIFPDIDRHKSDWIMLLSTFFSSAPKSSNSWLAVGAGLLVIFVGFLCGLIFNDSFFFWKSFKIFRNISTPLNFLPPGFETRSSSSGVIGPLSQQPIFLSIFLQFLHF